MEDVEEAAARVVARSRSALHSTQVAARLVDASQAVNNNENDNNNNERSIAQQQHQSTGSTVVQLHSIAVIPDAATDNCAIATCTVAQGTLVALPSHRATRTDTNSNGSNTTREGEVSPSPSTPIESPQATSSTSIAQLPLGGVLCIGGEVLEGHRFAIQPIEAGGALLSWGLPFGTALRPIPAGEPLLNDLMLTQLVTRGALGGVGVTTTRAGASSLSSRQRVNFSDPSSSDAFVCDWDQFVPRRYVVNSSIGKHGSTESRSQSRVTNTTAAGTTTTTGVAAAGASPTDCSGSAPAVGPPRCVSTDESDKAAAGSPAGTFLGYPRCSCRTASRRPAAGTRNHVVVLGLSSASSIFLRNVQQTLLSSSNNVVQKMKETPPVTCNDQQQQEGRMGASSTANQQLLTQSPGGIEPHLVRFVINTEGEATKQNNLPLLRRTLRGLIGHPNVGRVIVVYTGAERHLKPADVIDSEWLRQPHSTAAGAAPGTKQCCGTSPLVVSACMQSIEGHTFGSCCGPHVDVCSLDDSSETSFGVVRQKLMDMINGAVAAVSVISRVPVPLSYLSIALQCGGSDAFSGVTGNRLAGSIAKHFIHGHGSRALLAETPELVGAESYILDNTASLAVAQRFIATLERYKLYAAEHDQNAASNPSGGNLFRGLYNIALKSLGAARKKPADVTLDAVIEYGESMDAAVDDAADGATMAEQRQQNLTTSCRGDGGGAYVFMDSPGNDLESIAGQVASGCNLILFTTGNGSITNFPFVPTLKIVTTSARYKSLEADMDVDAGQLLQLVHDGNRENLFIDAVADQVRRIVSGEQLSKGELNHQHQVSVWRNWVDVSNQESSKVASTPERRGQLGELSSLLPPGEGTTNSPSNCCCGRSFALAPYIARPGVFPLATLPRTSAGIFFRSLPRLSVETLTWPVGERIVTSTKATTATTHSNWICGQHYHPVNIVVFPTSICSSEVALSMTRAFRSQDEDLLMGGQRQVPGHQKVNVGIKGTDGSGCSRLATRYVEVSHNEGCGSAGGVDIYAAIALGYVLHPYTAIAVMLEHGCEKTHNDYFRAELAKACGGTEGGEEDILDPADIAVVSGRRLPALRFASIQHDGGMQRIADVCWAEIASGREEIQSRLVTVVANTCVDGPVSEQGKQQQNQQLRAPEASSGKKQDQKEVVTSPPSVVPCTNTDPTVQENGGAALVVALHVESNVEQLCRANGVQTEELCAALDDVLAGLMELVVHKTPNYNAATRSTASAASSNSSGGFLLLPSSSPLLPQHAGCRHGSAFVRLVDDTTAPLVPYIGAPTIPFVSAEAGHNNGGTSLLHNSSLLAASGVHILSVPVGADDNEVLTCLSSNCHVLVTVTSMPPELAPISSLVPTFVFRAGVGNQSLAPERGSIATAPGLDIVLTAGDAVADALSAAAGSITLDVWRAMEHVGAEYRPTAFAVPRGQHGVSM